MNETRLCSKVMMLRFDSYTDRIAKRELKTLSYHAPFRFDSLDHLIMIMDDVMDSINFPRQEGELHRFNSRDDAQAYIFRKMDRTDLCTESELDAMTRTGFRSEMTVLVNKRERSSMQGRVLVRGKVIYFRSALELMRILHEYLEGRFQKV